MLDKWKELEQIEEALAEAKGRLADLTYFKNIVLAEQMIKELEGGAKSVSAARMYAENSEEYRTVVKAFGEITHEESRLWFLRNRVARQMGIL